VSYNAVGGIGVGGLPKPLREEARNRLMSAAFIGVRDPKTKADLDTWGLPVEVSLTPDSAVLAPDAFPMVELLPAASVTAREALSRLGPDYLVFQVGRYPAWGRVSDLAGQIREIHRKTGFGILLLPLGQAAGHEDRAPLEKIGSLLEDLPVELLSQPDVHDILTCIANASLFVGSSLHGNLMALVYGVPHVGFGERVVKLDLMMRTWDPTAPDGAAEPDAIADRALRAVNERCADPEPAIKALQDAAMAALRRQAQLIG
jgi:polysaccharide pyruvyl transferase WcaK-like protein